MRMMSKYKNFFNPSTWIKGFQLIFCGWLLTTLISVITLLSALQFIVLLFSGTQHRFLNDLGRNLNRYTQELIAFLTFQNHQPPPPFS